MLFANTKLSFILKGLESEIKYPTRAIISLCLNILNPFFGEPFHLGLLKKFTPYLCLVYARVVYTLKQFYASVDSIAKGTSI